MNRRRPNEKLEMLLLQYYIFSLGLNRWKPLIFQWIFQPVTIITQSPAGVHAQPSPSILAIKLVEIYSLAGWSRGILGNMKETNGEIPFVIFAINPDFCAISINPTHNAITPIMVIHKDTASPAESNAACDTASMFPVKAPNTTPIKIIKAQI